MDEENEPKISPVESFVVISLLAGLDAADLALLAFGLDDFFILDILSFPLTQLYFRMKGVRANYALIGNMFELLPYVDKLPMRTIGALATIRAANHPEGLVSEAVNIGGAVVRKKLQTAHNTSEGEAKGAEGQLKVIRGRASQTPSVEAQNAEARAAEARRKAEEAGRKFKSFEALRQKAALERGVSPETPSEEEQKEGESGAVIRPPFGEGQNDSEQAA